jgi:hypothetical protein
VESSILFSGLSSLRVIWCKGQGTLNHFSPKSRHVHMAAGLNSCQCLLCSGPKSTLKSLSAGAGRPFTGVLSHVPVCEHRLLGHCALWGSEGDESRTQPRAHGGPHTLSPLVFTHSWTPSCAGG